MKLDKGQKILEQELQNLLVAVQEGDFGDFTNEKWHTPKVILAEIFASMRQNVIDGKYDA